MFISDFLDMRILGNVCNQTVADVNAIVGSTPSAPYYDACEAGTGGKTYVETNRALR